MLRFYSLHDYLVGGMRFGFSLLFKGSLWMLPLLLLGGCSTLGYYSQSVGGHLALMAESREISGILADPDTPSGLRERLLQVQGIRAFAVTALQLPDNGSYRSYADLGREAVVWSLVATPEFSMQAKQWCYPVIGCASYRGYFAKEAAERHAAKLGQTGYDVAVESIPAYSTLGWFSDPLPSTVIDWPLPRIAGLIFHELAHQKLYVPGDSAFNEAFANALQQHGVELWLQHQGVPSELEKWRQHGRREAAFIRLLMQTRSALASLYGRDLPEQAMRAAKQRVFLQLRTDYAALKQGWGGYSGYDRWFEREPNNARLASIATYEHWLPAFRKMLSEAPDMALFYQQCRDLAEQTRAEREVSLSQLLQQVED